MPKVRDGVIALKDIVIDQSYLSRVKPSTQTIDDYVESLINGADLSTKDPIVLEDGTNKLFGGYHRTKAHLKYLELLQQRQHKEDISETLDLWPEMDIEVPCEFHTCPEGITPSLYAFTFNNEHGLQQSSEDAKKVCRDQYIAFPGTPFKLLMSTTKKSEPTIRKYLGDLLEEFEHTRAAAIERLKLLGWSQEETAEALTRLWPEGTVSQRQVSTILEENEKVLLSSKTDFAKNTSITTLAKRYDMPELVMWSLVLQGKIDQDRFNALDITIQPYDALHFQGSHDRFGTDGYPGRIPGQLVAHILHWFTQPGATVLDPMAGGGTVPDVCLALGRNCYAYDINQSTRIDIIPHNIVTDGWPERVKKANLIFWDPPYFNKKDDGYPDQSISRLTREQYLKFFETAFAEAKQTVKKGTVLTFLMSDWNDTDGKKPGIFLWDYADLLRQSGWTLTEHIQVPLSTQQVHPDIVTKFRKDGRRARLERYLLVAEA